MCRIGPSENIDLFGVTSATMGQISKNCHTEMTHVGDGGLKIRGYESHAPFRGFNLAVHNKTEPAKRVRRCVAVDF